jgi:hypothetical protein
MKGFARNAARTSIIAGAVVALSAYSTNADFITLANFDSSAEVSDCGDIRISKLPNGKLQWPVVHAAHKIEGKGNQICLDGKPCMWKCGQSVTC